MNKNEQYVGVDEKYIPENEKTTDNNLNNEIREDMNKVYHGAKEYVTDKDNQQKIKKVAKGFGIGYLIFVGAIVLIGICILIFVFSTLFTINRENKQATKKFDEVWNKANNTINDGYDKIAVDDFNSDIESYNGTNDGSDVAELIDSVTTTLKKNTDHKITVIYGSTKASKPEEIVLLKKQFKEDAQYEVLIDYDLKGYINKIKITNY